jgi:hypothetical protein
MLHLAALLAAAAPAPFLKPAPPMPYAVLAAPGVAAADLAAQIASQDFLLAAMRIRFPAPPEVSPEWVRPCLRLTPQHDGRSVRVELVRCNEAAALGVLEVIVEEHLRRHVPARRARMRENEGKLKAELLRLPPKYRVLIREYFRKLHEKEHDGLVLRWPEPVSR